MMTGCGSVLWMAPEILRGQKYNEKVDVYSYGMCLLELVSCKVPWKGVSNNAEVPHKVTSGKRPEAQLGDTDEDLCDLIKRCWAQQSQQRPSFHEIVDELEPKLAYTTGAE